MEFINQHLILNFGLNILSVLIIVFFLHFRIYKKSEYIFTYIIFNLIIFLLSYLIINNTASLSAGGAFGLFAVFSMIRYRTEDITTKDMTYLFIVIALGMINGRDTPIVQLVLFNIILVAGAWLLESNLIMKREFMQIIQYENIQNIKPENRALLIQDLTERTGLQINRVEIGKIDFLRDTAIIKIYHY